MPDVPARIGVPVWRVERRDFRGTFSYREFEKDDRDEPGLWFASSPEAVAEMRERIAQALYRFDAAGEIPRHTMLRNADAVLRALGFES